MEEDKATVQIWYVGSW